MANPPVMATAIPRNTVSPTKVTMKGLIPQLAIANPLSKPIRAPPSNAIRIVTGMGTALRNSRAAITPINPVIEPTAISIPEVMITKFSPTATIAIVEIARNKFIKLVSVRKYGENTVNTAHKNTIATGRNNLTR